jgi:hypothetical protein
MPNYFFREISVGYEKKSENIGRKYGLRYTRPKLIPKKEVKMQ